MIPLSVGSKPGGGKKAGSIPKNNY